MDGTYRVVSRTIFISLSTINVLVPVLYAYFSFQINVSVRDPPAEQQAVWEANYIQFYTFKYLIGVDQSISAIFMLWAVIKLYVAIGKSETLSALLDQRMITMHIVTFMVYLASVAIYYIFFGLWDDEDE